MQGNLRDIMIYGVGGLMDRRLKIALEIELFSWKVLNPLLNRSSYQKTRNNSPPPPGVVYEPNKYLFENSHRVYRSRLVFRYRFDIATVCCCCGLFFSPTTLNTLTHYLLTADSVSKTISVQINGGSLTRLGKGVLRMQISDSNCLVSAARAF